MTTSPRFYVIRPGGLIPIVGAVPGIDRTAALWNAAEHDPWLAAHLKRNGTGNLTAAKRRGYRVLEAAELSDGDA